MEAHTRSSRARWRQVALASLAIAASLALAACGGGGSSSDDGTATGGGEGGGHTIALVPAQSPFPYFDTQARGAIEEADRLGDKLDYVSVPQYDARVQTRALDATLATHPDFLLTSPVDPVAIRAPIQRFLNADIPVITVGGGLKDTSGLVSAIQTDNYQGGQLVGEALGKLMRGSGSLAVLNIVPGDPTLDARVEGCLDVLREKYPDISVLPTEYPGPTPAKAQSTMRSMLLAHPDIKGVFGVAEVNAEGAAAAIRAVGKTGEISVAAFDASPAEVKALKAGDIQFLSVSQPGKQGALAVQYANRYLAGDRSGIPQLVRVPNVGVDLDNVDDPAIQKLFYRTGTS